MPWHWIRILVWTYHESWLETPREETLVSGVTRRETLRSVNTGKHRETRKMNTKYTHYIRKPTKVPFLPLYLYFNHSLFSIFSPSMHSLFPNNSCNPFCRVQNINYWSPWKMPGSGNSMWAAQPCSLSCDTFLSINCLSLDNSALLFPPHLL